MEPGEWAAVRDIVLGQNPVLIMSHLACSDTPDHPMNAAQLRAFRDMTDGLDIPRSLAATGGILLGADYHFDITRAGIGLCGGMPFAGAAPVVTLNIPVIQLRDVAPGEFVGYGAFYTPSHPARIATVAAGYGDGLHRIMGPRACLLAGETRCPVVGRISMDLIGVDVTAAPEVPDELEPDRPAPAY